MSNKQLENLYHKADRKQSFWTGFFTATFFFVIIIYFLIDGTNTNNNIDEYTYEYELEECQQELVDAKDCADELEYALIDAENIISNSLFELEYGIDGDYYDLYNAMDSSIDNLNSFDYSYYSCN